MVEKYFYKSFKIGINIPDERKVEINSNAVSGNLSQIVTNVMSNGGGGGGNPAPSVGRVHSR